MEIIRNYSRFSDKSFILSTDKVSAFQEIDLLQECPVKKMLKSVLANLNTNTYIWKTFNETLSAQGKKL